jgi:hypothetical protein
MRCFSPTIVPGTSHNRPFSPTNRPGSVMQPCDWLIIVIIRHYISNISDMDATSLHPLHDDLPELANMIELHGCAKPYVGLVIDTAKKLTYFIQDYNLNLRRRVKVLGGGNVKRYRCIQNACSWECVASRVERKLCVSSASASLSYTTSTLSDRVLFTMCLRDSSATSPRSLQLSLRARK